MGKRLSTEEFIAKAKETHGDKYDYSKTVYVNQTTPVVIICPEHGEFLQRPNNHYVGAGCPACGGNKRLDTELFITKAKEIHGDKYDYSRVSYKNNKTKVKIICPEHGEFLQTPEKHLLGRGCPKCGSEQCKQTIVERYGVAHPLQNKDILDKARRTNLIKYGVENPMKADDVKQRQIQTCMERYDVPYAIQDKNVANKRRETCIEKYGGESPFSSEEIRQKSYDTLRRKYGVDNSMHLQSSVYKVNKSKFINNTFHVSKPENYLYDMLCKKFGKNDIIRQHSSEIYPFACDFYIKSRDLHIELNASWTHGGHWFGDCEEDNDIRDLWMSKHTDYYDNAVSVWTDKDVMKRKTAESNNLNYVVFWDNKLRDAVVWFALDCPDGQDYVKSYSWLPDRHINPSDYDIELTGTHSNISAIAKHYQFSVFYARELHMWNDNVKIKRLPVQVLIYYNRYKYLDKTPYELSDAEIMRAFGISGICKNYTIFDSSLMQQVLDKYNVRAVYDPCAGWGERMLCCHYNNVAYTGVDINVKLKTGYEAMMSAYKISNQNIIYSDSAKYDVDKHYDAVITCPPYHDIEIYSDAGVENLDYQSFLSWWAQVVHKCKDIKYFCFQINNRYKDDMSSIVENCGFTLIDTLQFSSHKSSHFTRRGGSDLKRESETMLVFEKKNVCANNVMNIKDIKSLRSYMNMSQSKFAKYLGVSLSCLQSWEQGKRHMPEYIFAAFKKIAAYEQMFGKLE